ncbi:MAG TPA: IS200/IS605 family transposase [Methanosarcina sp.]|nr:IS200/IS605 family transposase [Methanosarcina sp.]
MAYVKNWLHLVWGTKNRIPFLTENILDQVLYHIKTNASEKKIYIDTINGYKDHIHCLISLHSEQTVSKVIQLLKGESSFWINKNKLTRFKFEWAVEYFGVSVSESHVPVIRNYINNQSEHHRIKTWEDEYNELIVKSGFDRFN